MYRRRTTSLLLLAMIYATSLQSCISFNRYDLMERWKINEDSPACDLKSKIPNVEDKYSMKAIGQRMLVESMNFTLDFDDNWISEKFKYNYSVSVNRDRVKIPHFLTFVPTEDKKLEGTYAYEQADGIKSYRRTIYYIKKGEIYTDGNSNSLIMLIVLCTIFGIFVVLSVTSRIMNFGVAFMSSLIITFSITTGMWLIPNYGGFIALLIVLGLFSLTMAIINWKCLHTLGSIAFGFVAVVFYLVGTSIEYKYSYPFVAVALGLASTWFAWKLPGMMFFDKLKFFGLHFFFWLLEYSFWSHIFFIYPAELYLRMRLGDWYYPIGKPGTGITIYWPMIVAGAGALGLSIVSGIIAISRTGRAGYGPDSGQGGYKPLI